jgi:hypothetical protein
MYMVQSELICQVRLYLVILSLYRRRVGNLQRKIKAMTALCRGFNSVGHIVVVANFTYFCTVTLATPLLPAEWPPWVCLQFQAAAGRSSRPQFRRLPTHPLVRARPSQTENEVVKCSRRMLLMNVKGAVEFRLLPLPPTPTYNECSASKLNAAEHNVQGPNQNFPDSLLQGHMKHMYMIYSSVNYHLLQLCLKFILFYDVFY